LSVDLGVGRADTRLRGRGARRARSRFYRVRAVELGVGSVRGGLDARDVCVVEPEVVCDSRGGIDGHQGACASGVYVCGDRPVAGPRLADGEAVSRAWRAAGVSPAADAVQAG